MRDPAQQSLVERFETLQHDIEQANARPRRFFKHIFGTPATAVRGLYIYGGVGRGKTFLMDLFFETLRLGAKKRIHFHRMMHDVHRRLASSRTHSIELRPTLPARRGCSALTNSSSATSATR